MKLTKSEIAEMKLDHKYWNEFGSAIGWRLIGFTNRIHAGFDTGRKVAYLPGFSITGGERDAIMAAINRGKVVMDNDTKRETQIHSRVNRQREKDGHRQRGQDA
jgi:hypothetical protein